MNKKLKLVMLCCLATVCFVAFLLFCVTVFFRGHIYMEKDVSFDSFYKIKSFWMQPSKVLVPKYARNISYRVIFPGYTFHVAFHIPKDKFMPYLAKFKKVIVTPLISPVIQDKVTLLEPINNGYAYSFSYTFNEKNIYIDGYYDSQDEIISLTSKGAK